MFISPILYQGTEPIPHTLNKQELAKDCNGGFLREWVNIKVQTRRNVRNLTFFSRKSESTHDLHLLDTSEKHLSVVKHKNPGLLCQYILQKVIKVLEAQNCTLIEYREFYIFFSPSKKGLCVVTKPFIGLSHSQAAKD